MGQRNALAEARKRAQKRRRQRKNRVGGGGENSSSHARDFYSPLKIDGHEFWWLDGWPFESKTENRVVVRGGRFWITSGSGNEMDVVLMEPWHLTILPIHRINQIGDASVVGKRYSSRAVKLNYCCTKKDLLDDMPEDWSPSPGWVQIHDDDDELVNEGIREWVLEVEGDHSGHFSVSVEELEDGSYQLHPLDAHTNINARKYYSTYERMEDAQWEAEALQQEALSCMFCAQNKIDVISGLKRKEGACGSAFDIVCIPMLNLTYWFGEEPKKSKVKGREYDRGQLSMPDNDLLYWPTEDDKYGAIAGWGYIDTSMYKSKNSSKWKTLSNYHELTWMNQLTCKSCLGENGNLTHRNHHKLDVTRVGCPQCGTSLQLQRQEVSKRSGEVVTFDVVLEGEGIHNWPSFQETQIDPETEEDIVETAGIYQLLNQVMCECAVCGYYGLFEGEFECSTPGCDDPKGLLNHETMTRIALDDEGGFYTFERVTDPEDHRIYWPDFSDLHATTDKDDRTVQSMLDPALEDFHTFLNVRKSGDIPYLSPRDQLRLIGGDVLDLNAAHGERR